MNTKLKTMDAETLMNTPMAPIKFIIDGLLPQGLHILAGSPKIGKSWMSLWLALQISKGETVWDFQTKKSDVLYLCLEDGFSRIQDRLFKITDEAPSTLHFAIMSGKINNGLETQIENFLKEHPNTGFIIIDTFQHIRDSSTPGANVYEKDYDDVNVLKQLADKNHIAMLIIHHLRKTGDSDPLNMISGSAGISGSADGSYILQKAKRTENDANFICVGRDIEQRELSLTFNKETFLWELLEGVEKVEIQLPSEIILLCNFIKEMTAFEGTATELAEFLKLFEESETVYSPASLKKKIIKHIGFLSENGIAYTDKRTFERRAFTLVYDSMTDTTLPFITPLPENLPSEASVPSALPLNPHTA